LKNAGISISSEERKEEKPHHLNLVFGTFSPISIPTAKEQSFTHQNPILKNVSPEEETGSLGDEKKEKDEKASTTSSPKSTHNVEEQPTEQAFPPRIQLYRSWASEAEAEENNDDDDKSFTDEAPVTMFPPQSLLETEEKLVTSRGSVPHLTRELSKKFLLIVSKTVGMDSIAELEKTDINPDNFGATEIIRLLNSGIIVKCDSETGASALQKVISEELSQLDVKLTDFSSNIVCLHNLPQEISADEIQQTIFENYNENPLKIQFVLYEVSNRQNEKIALLDVSDSLMNKIEACPSVKVQGNSREIFLLLSAEPADERPVEASSSPRIVQDSDLEENNQNFIEKTSSESMRDEAEEERDKDDSDDDRSFTQEALVTISPEERHPHLTTKALTPQTVGNNILLIFPNAPGTDTVVELGKSGINLDNFHVIDSVRLVDSGVIVECDSEAAAIRLQEVIMDTNKMLNVELIDFSSNVFCIYNVPQDITDDEMRLIILEKYDEKPLKVKFVPYEISTEQHEKIVLLELSNSLVKKIEPPPIIKIRGTEREMYVVFMSDGEGQSTEQSLFPKIVHPGSSDADKNNQYFVGDISPKMSPTKSILNVEDKLVGQSSPSKACKSDSPVEKARRIFFQEEGQMIEQIHSPKETKEEEDQNLSEVTSPKASHAKSLIHSKEQFVEHMSFPKPICTAEEKRKGKDEDPNKETSITTSPTKSVEQPPSPKKSITRRERAAARPNAFE
jgi:hypothetical protein